MEQFGLIIIVIGGAILVQLVEILLDTRLGFLRGERDEGADRSLENLSVVVGSFLDSCIGFVDFTWLMDKRLTTVSEQIDDDTVEVGELDGSDFDRLLGLLLLASFFLSLDGTECSRKTVDFVFDFFLEERDDVLFFFAI